MKHLGPIRPDRPARRYWRDAGLAFAGAAGWMALNALVDGGIVAQAIMLVIVMIAVPAAIYAASALRSPLAEQHAEVESRKPRPDRPQHGLAAGDGVGDRQHARSARKASADRAVTLRAAGSTAAIAQGPRLTVPRPARTGVK